MGRGEGMGKQESAECVWSEFEDTGRTTREAGSRHGLWGGGRGVHRQAGERMMSTSVWRKHESVSSYQLGTRE